jgi:hypothetical protein
MKFVVLLVLIACVAAVPVQQVPEPVAAKIEEALKLPETNTEAPKVEVPKVEETKVEVPKVEEPKVEQKAEPASAHEVIREQALAQVLKAVGDLSSSPISSEESNMLKEVMTKGSSILAEAEKKAKALQSVPEFQTLLQSDALFGIKADGSIDASIATDQLTQLMSLMTGTTVSDKEKEMVHQLIAGFAGLFTPIVTGHDPMQTDFERLAEQFTSKFDKVQQTMNSKDKLLDSQALLSVMSETSEGIDTQLLADVTTKFMDRISSQFEKVISDLDKPLA